MTCSYMSTRRIMVGYALGAPNVNSFEEFIISMTDGPFKQVTSTLKW